VAELATERQYVGDGWQPLIDEIDARILDYCGPYEVLQIKEKFGGLRFYWAATEGTPESSVKQARDYVHEQEALSFTICEWCGQPGENEAPHGWYKTLCYEHREEDNQRHAQERGNRIT